MKPARRTPAAIGEAAIEMLASIDSSAEVGRLRAERACAERWAFVPAVLIALAAGMWVAVSLAPEGIR